MEVRASERDEKQTSLDTSAAADKLYAQPTSAQLRHVATMRRPPCWSVRADGATRAKPGHSINSENDGSIMAIKERITSMLEMRRLRRRQVQLPLLAFGVASVALGCVIFVLGIGHSDALPFDYRWAFSAIFTGGFVFSIAAMPGDELFVRLLLACEVVAGGVIIGLQVGPLLAEVELLRSGSWSTTPIYRRLLALQLVHVIVRAFYLAVATLLACLVPCGVLLASHCQLLSAHRLTVVVFRLVCLMYGVFSVQYASYVIVESLREHVKHDLLGVPFDSELIGVYAFHAILCAALSCAGLRDDRLRSRVHGFLAMRAHGVTAAAGIAEMLDGVKASHVLQHAATSFRAVSLAELTLDHLRPAPVTEAGSLSASRRLLRSSVALLRRSRRPKDSVALADGGELAAAAAALAAELPPDPVRIAAACASPEHGVGTEHAHGARGEGAHTAPPADNVARLAKLGQVDAFVSHSWCAHARARSNARSNANGARTTL